MDISSLEHQFQANFYRKPNLINIILYFFVMGWRLATISPDVKRSDDAAFIFD